MGAPIKQVRDNCQLNFNMNTRVPTILFEGNKNLFFKLKNFKPKTEKFCYLF